MLAHLSILPLVMLVLWNPRLNNVTMELTAPGNFRSRRSIQLCRPQGWAADQNDRPRYLRRHGQWSRPGLSPPLTLPCGVQLGAMQLDDGPQQHLQARKLHKGVLKRMRQRASAFSQTANHGFVCCFLQNSGLGVTPQPRVGSLAPLTNILAQKTGAPTPYEAEYVSNITNCTVTL
ncbi:hypothetical protein BD289DRAFT_21761 [Coniella lustricola]|uniref:Uncharacterized protein n=1 Tax=Coniella lustricola TaxID=2025994 RepID=A0A2T3A3N7_9PEZI|nr:hypothetical protein BD289DRAFT_21761 [Coniella lustricola]